MPFFQVRQRVSPFYQYRLRSAIKVIVAIETIILRLPHPVSLNNNILHTTNEHLWWVALGVKIGLIMMAIFMFMSLLFVAG